LPLFLEKPVATSWEQAAQLRAAAERTSSPVVVSFPLRVSAMCELAKEIVDSGVLGPIGQVQAVNNVPAYAAGYYHGWMRDEAETGGLWLQKATHDFDYITQLMGATPTHVTAMQSRCIYGGDKPAELRCSRCDDTEKCKESPINLTRRGDDGGMLSFQKPTSDADHDCCFSESIKNQDAGSAIIMFDNGAHAAFSHNFVVRRSAGRRGATVIGYDATLNFAWEADDKIRIIDHHSDKVELIDVPAGVFHGGGDNVLAQNFVDLLRGRAASICPLDQGLLSAAMCLAARDSANLQSWQPIRLPDAAKRATVRPVREVEPIP
jgi:predicted dehydrogenase